MYALRERAKLGILCLLLLLMLGILAFTAVNTVQAVRNFQQQNSAIKAGDVHAIHPWMTIHMISHIYHVPEDYLYRSLNMNSPDQIRHATLNEIANRNRQPIDQVIRTIQHAILTYRKKQPPSMPMPPPQHSVRHAPPATGRAKY
ncbi:MAG TPA: hypothetical protein VK140_05310 [Ktedonobacteraceae bacterium]|nr:hypothetical protein [Ktedonobacteraceae bacterium]